MSELLARVAAAQATLDSVKNERFRLGHVDCARMTAGHLRRMGHKVRLPAKGSYGTARGALKALAKRGHADLLAAMDAFGFERIPPAAALPGDVLAATTESPIGCLTVVLNNGRVVGFHDDAATGIVLQPLDYVAAWRVPITEA